MRAREHPDLREVKETPTELLEAAAAELRAQHAAGTQPDWVLHVARGMETAALTVLGREWGQIANKSWHELHIAWGVLKAQPRPGFLKNERLTGVNQGS